MAVTSFHTALLRLPSETEFTVSITPTKPGSEFPNIHGKLVRHLNRFSLQEDDRPSTEAPAKKPPAKKRPSRSKKPVIR